ncbi:MAG: alpha-glucosidase C-terminal domain-containing protein, partial [Hyphomicrobiales bacterium]
ILRLDAVAFTWKRLGTSCENLPEAHLLIQAFNALTSIVAPSLLFLSEAIVHPDEVIKYIREDECQLSYNPQLMALLWSTMATRDVTLLRKAMQRRFRVPDECAWVNYVRCHDDIGWVFSNDDAVECGIDPDGHRRFLGDFYTGRFEGSFSRGLPFQEDPATGDMRVSGMAASLAGLEIAEESGDAERIEEAVRRLLLLYGVAITIGGIPLVYLGDEIAMLNDHDYAADPEKRGDTRWLHRPQFDETRFASRHDRSTAAGQVFLGLMRLLQVRQQNRAFGSADTEFVDTENPHVFGYFRRHQGQSVLVLANFSEKPQTIAARRLRTLGLRRTVTDVIKGGIIIATEQLELEPYQLSALLAAE